MENPYIKFDSKTYETYANSIIICCQFIYSHGGLFINLGWGSLVDFPGHCMEGTLHH